MKQSPTRTTLSLYKKYTKRYAGAFWIGSVGAALATITQDLIPPFVVSRTFSRLQIAYARHEVLHFGTFVPYFAVYAAAMLTGMVLWRLQSYFVWQLEINANRDMASDIYRHIQAQSQRFHADRFAGGLVSQTNKFIAAYERLMDDLIWNIIPGVTAFIVATSVLFFISYRYALILLVIATIYIFIMRRRVIRQAPFNAATAKKDSAQTAALADNIANMSTIRAFANEKLENKRFSGVLHDRFLAEKRLSVEVLKTEALSHSQTNLFLVISFLFGLIAITSYHANVSALYLVLSYTQNIVNRLWQFSRIMRNVNRSFGDAIEMTEILGIVPEVADPEESEAVRMLRGDIRLSGVTFYYPEDKLHPLFENLDLHIKPGEKIGLVGPSGGGKTTITKLLLRFMDIQDGSIAIDGQNIAAVRQSDLRSRITYVAQEPILFHRSLQENIAYGNPHASIEEVIAAAKMANAHEFIERLPDSYGTLVGERGIKLSGGQRQRVAIARAILKNAPILVLDEATSALDSESEVLIQEALWKLMEGKTAIVIAHRLSTIQKMDRIVVLERGRIVEAGTHKELIRHSGGTYSKLWAHQSGGFIEE